MSEKTAKIYAAETYGFVLELIKSPSQNLQKKHELNWWQIVIYFSIVSVCTNLIISILSGGFALMFVFPIQITIGQLVYLGLMLWVSTLILNKNEVVITEIELAQVWLKGAIFGTILNLGFLFLRMSTVSGLNALMGIAPAVLIAGSTYIYLHKGKEVAKEKATNMSLIIGAILAVLPLGSYSSLYWMF